MSQRRVISNQPRNNVVYVNVKQCQINVVYFNVGVNNVGVNNVRLRRNNVVIFNVEFHNVVSRRHNVVNVIIFKKLKSKKKKLLNLKRKMTQLISKTCFRL